MIQDKTLSLQKIIKTFKSNIGLIALSTLVVGTIGSTYALFIATPKYTASTQLIAKISNDNAAALAGQVQATNQMSTTLAQVLVSPTIITKVKSDLNLSESVNQIKSELAVTSSSTSQVLTLTVSNSNPYQAAAIANQTSKVFIEQAPKLANVSNIGVLANAAVNKTPKSPNKPIIIGGSIIAGITAGLMLSLAKLLFSTKVASQEDVEALNANYLGGISKLK